MHIEKITITGFRCFGSVPTVIPLSAGLTAFVGPNGSGKTAVLHALLRLFGITRAERTIVPNDFHRLLVETTPPSFRELSIDVLLKLPELIGGSATAPTVAPLFQRISITTPGGVPLCRMRLSARWDADGTAEGTVNQTLHWVNTDADLVRDDQCSPVLPHERGLIQLLYTPATRDASSQIRATTGALAARLIKAIEWSAQTQGSVETAANQMTEAFGNERAILAFNDALNRRWSNLSNGDVECNPELNLISRRFEDVIARIGVLFRHGTAGDIRSLDELSDGQQSLFYFALAAAVFDLERAAISGTIHGFRSDELNLPALTLFAIEEPENHLSPYYLSRIMDQIRSLTGTGFGQALIASHSPSILARVPPDDVRYCRRDPASGCSSVRTIPMPLDESDAIKFVRNAMLAFPELYFARFVLLVEGDSERLVIPKLAEAIGLHIDPSFVAIVPLGGRHVQHFWRLLHGLQIPYATLLDLDLGRSGGGFGRIKNVLQQRLALGVPRADILTLNDGSILNDQALAQMDTWEEENLIGWLNYLENSSAVYFSVPLDLDLAMLAAFPRAYEATIEGRGPRQSVENAAEMVLGTAGSGLTSFTGDWENFLNHMPAYRYHFLSNRGKPVTHLRALNHIEPAQLAAGMPLVLLRVLDRIRVELSGL